MAYLFWASVAWLLYSLVIYPSFVTLVGLRTGRRTATPEMRSSISVIIAVHNGEKIIAQKLHQLLMFSDDFDFFEIIVASDGSTDATEEVVYPFAKYGVQLMASPLRIGKTRALDEAVKLASGDVLVFCDASGSFGADGMSALIERFSDSAVGCVGGYVRYPRRAEGGAIFRAFKRVDLWMKRGEGRLGYVPAVSGAVHALRRGLYRASDPAATRDIVDPAQAVSAGYRCVYEPDAILEENSRKVTATRFDARVRMTMRGMSSTMAVLGEFRNARLPLAGSIFVSHKLMRWWLWVPILGLLSSSLALASTHAIYLSTALGFATFAMLGGAGLMLEKRAPAPLSAAAFGLTQTSAMCVGTLRWLRGDAAPTWEVVE